MLQSSYFETPTCAGLLFGVQWVINIADYTSPTIHRRPYIADAINYSARRQQRKHHRPVSNPAYGKSRYILKPSCGNVYGLEETLFQAFLCVIMFSSNANVH